MGRDFIVQKSLARVRSSLHFSLNDVLFHHIHMIISSLSYPGFESDWMLNSFNGSLCTEWSSIAHYHHYHHPTVLIWRKYCLKGRKNRVIYSPVPFHSKHGPKILFYFILNENLCCDPSLEPFRQADSNEGSQLSF